LSDEHNTPPETNAAAAYAGLRVVLLSGSLRLSGSSTWILALQRALREIGCPVVHIAMGEPSQVAVPEDLDVRYTGRARRHWLLRACRLLQFHKLFPRWFEAKADEIIGERIGAILRHAGWQDRLDLVIKDFTCATPSCVKAWPLVAVIHQNLSQDWFDPDMRSKAEPGFMLAAVSKAVAEDARALGLEIPHILYNPLDVTRLRQLAAGEKPQGEFLVFAGSLHRNKGVYELLEAYALAGLSQQLYFVGSGQELAGLQQRARELEVADRLVFTGFQDNPYPYMSAARLLVLPSHREAMGYVCLEAAALGTPFLVSDYPAAAEFFDADAQICLAPQTDFVERLACRLVDAMKYPEPPGVRMGVMEKLAPEAVAKSYLSLIDFG
jgi:glycosyltransferase involved in cell wall biosynthesis